VVAAAATLIMPPLEQDNWCRLAGLLYARWKDQSCSMEASTNMVSPVHERCQEMISANGGTSQ